MKVTTHITNLEAEQTCCYQGCSADMEHETFLSEVKNVFQILPSTFSIEVIVQLKYFNGNMANKQKQCMSIFNAGALIQL